jgi:formylmethanofuran dehydrogenase subunit D
MSDFTQATVIVAAVDQVVAQAEMGDTVFTTGASPKGILPATVYFTSGPWSNAEMSKMANDVTWPKKMYFGTEWQDALDQLKLKMITESPSM